METQNMSNVTKELHEQLLKIVLTALIVEDNETERSIIVSTYFDLLEILSK